MARCIEFSIASLEGAVKLEMDSPTDEVIMLQNLNIFLYEKVMRLRTENKSLSEKLNCFGAIVKKEWKAREKVKLKSHAGMHITREHIVPYTPHQDEVKHQEGAHIK
eukprot:Gb_28832 [translate_table: standard]